MVITLPSIMVRSNNQLPTNLLQLQNCIKRDAESYKEEFQLQHTHFKALLDVVRLNPSSPDKQFEELSMFMAQVAPSYKDELKTLPNDLMDVLKTFSTLLHPDVRLTLVKALILMRNRGLLTETDLLTLFFQLLRCQDKELRKFLKNHLITDIKNMDRKQKDVRVKTKLQNFMYSMMSEGSVAGKMSLDIMSELYKKHVWRDAKTVNVIGEACLSRVTKLMVTGLRFFLGRDEEEEKESSSEEEEGREESMAWAKKARKNQRLSNCVNSKSRKRVKVMRRLEKKMKKQTTPTIHSDFSALHLIYDPQGMAEKLLTIVECVNERFEVKIMLMNLIARLVGVHELFLFNFYPLLQRYLRPHQSEVTKILLFVAQSTHERVPPDILEPVVKTITENFISERNSAECITVGINSIREICSRCPLVMNEDLLHDLAMYQKYKDKNVSMAARSLVHLFRVTNPALLKRKDRGRPTEATAELQPKSYGESRPPTFVPGAEILAENNLEDEDGDENDEDENDEDGDEEWEDDDDDDEANDGWESCSDEGSNGDDDEWSEVSSDDEDEESKKKGGKDGEKGGKDGEKEKPRSRKEEREELMKVRSEEASLISSTRILTDEEFKMIRKGQLKKQFEALHPRNQKKKRVESDEELDGKKRRVESDEESESEEEVMEKKELVSLRDIERLYKKPRENKESRLATVVAGREGREKFGKRKEKMNPHSSTKEKEKKKNKAFSMIKHKVRGKKKKSFQDKQRELKSRLIKKLKHSHK